MLVNILFHTLPTSFKDGAHRAFISIWVSICEIGYRIGWRTVISLFLCLGCSVAISAQSAHKPLRKGDYLYSRAKYSEAGKQYADALKADPANAKAQYNLGSSQYQEGKYEDATKTLSAAAKSATTPTERADAWHNLGNALLKQNKFKEAVEAYQNSLRARPGDAGTKQNLQMAKQKLKEQQEKEQQQKDQQNQDQNQQNKDQQQQDPQQNQPQDQQQKQDQQQQPQQNDAQKNEENKPQPKLQASQEQLLKSIGRDDQRNKKKYQESTQSAKPNSRRKDW